MYQVEQHRWVNTKCLGYVSSAHAPVQVHVKHLVLNTCSPVILLCAINSHSLVLLIITQNHAQIILQTTRYITGCSFFSSTQHHEYFSLFSGYLRSVDVIGETNFLVTNKAQTFHWEAYGLKLHIPEEALPASLEECKIQIKVALSGQFELPQNTSLVSAVYCLDSDPQCNFSKPLTLEMQHCAKPSQMSRLSFARCSQNSLPCTFEILKGGEFSNRSAYGSIQLHSFSLITQLLSRLAMILGEDNVKYRARLYYLMRGVDRREIHFLITKDLDAHATVCC